MGQTMMLMVVVIMVVQGGDGDIIVGDFDGNEDNANATRCVLGGGVVRGLTWVLPAHLSIDVAVHCAHNEWGQRREHHIVQRHIEVCIATEAELSIHLHTVCQAIFPLLHSAVLFACDLSGETDWLAG